MKYEKESKMRSNFWEKIQESTWEKRIQEAIDRQVSHLVLDTVKSYEEIYEYDQKTGDIYFDDLKFFLRKGLRFHYLNRIFTDLKKVDAIHLPATSENDDSHVNISLYAHTIKSAKSIFNIKEYSNSQRCNLALLLLIRGTCSCQKILEIHGISIEDHDMYASYVITAHKDDDLLTAFRQYLYLHFLLTRTKKVQLR